MNDYMEVRLDFHPKPGLTPMLTLEDATDIMAGQLAALGYESFVPDSEGLTAYVRKADYSAQALSQAIADFPGRDFDISSEATLVEGRDWNSEWEKNYFQPIVVGSDCVIHSSFHTDYPSCRYDITIDPKMAFGTGHHATTSQIIEALLRLNLEGKTVIDMGTGTAILAILAAMRGAAKVTGIEIDEFAVINARENVMLNSHPEVEVLHGDASLLQGMKCNVFIANINRNVITGDIAAYAATLAQGGTMLLSGFYENDIPVVLAAAEPMGLKYVSHTKKEGEWACLTLEKR